jgi:hypothetical protein
MKAAEIEMESMRNTMAKKEEAFQATSDDFKACQDRELVLIDKCDEISRGIAEKEECIVELEAELLALEDEKASKGNSEGEMAQAVEERDLAGMYIYVYMYD